MIETTTWFTHTNFNTIQLLCLFEHTNRFINMQWNSKMGQFVSIVDYSSNLLNLIFFFSFFLFKHSNTVKCGLWLFFWMYSTFWNQLCCHIGLLLSKEIRTKNNFIDAKLHIIQKHARYLFSHKVIRNVIAFILLDLDWLLLLFFVLILFIFVCFFTFFCCRLSYSMCSHLFIYVYMIFVFTLI